MIETKNPILGLIEFLREHRRQAEIRELYDEVEKLKQSQGQATTVEPEQPAPVIISPVINNLDNSDFRLSVSDYNPATAITDPCDVLDKWYRWVDSEDGYSVHDATASPNAITKTSDGIKWDAGAHVLSINGGYRFATRLFRTYASTSGNNLFFSMTANHSPFVYAVHSFTDDGLVRCAYTETYGMSLVNGMTVEFPNVIVPNFSGVYTKPQSLQFSEPVEILDITAAPDITIGYPGASQSTFKSFTCRLRKLGENDYVRNMGTYLFDLSVPAEDIRYCQIRSMPNPGIKIKVSILEEKEGAPGEQVVFPESSEVTKKVTLDIPKPFGNTFTGFLSDTANGTLSVPFLPDTVRYSGKEQWLEIQLLNKDGDPASTLDLPPNTFAIENVALSTSPGPWAESSRDQVIEQSCNLTATSWRIIDGGLPRTGTIYEGGGGGTANTPTRQVDPNWSFDPSYVDPLNPWRITQAPI